MLNEPHSWNKLNVVMIDHFHMLWWIQLANKFLGISYIYIHEKQSVCNFIFLYCCGSILAFSYTSFI